MDSHQQQQYRREGEIPSFSSTLLDAIYRSIDEGHGGGGGEDELQVVYRETMKTEKHSNFGHVGVGNDVDMASLQRACLIDKWMEKKVSEKVIVRSRNQQDSSLLFNSSSSSSDSSCGGGFSSSEAESVPKPKPIRTSTNSGTNSGKNYQQENDQKKQQKPKSEGGFVKTKSRALKIYGDLKKVKQPISPGGRLASFLNSLFTTGNTKKPNISSSNGGRVVSYEDASNMERKSKSTHASTCSSASSFSRSCLSKTPSSRGNLNSSTINNNNNNNGSTKRSVRFYPVSVIVDEDCQPIGQKSVYGERFDCHAVKYGRNSVNGDDELKARSYEKNRRVEEAARNLLKNYQKKVECEMDLRNGDEIDEDDDEEEDDDAASYASSDLFELDHLSERYREELPVYETTRLDKNRVIVNSLFM